MDMDIIPQDQNKRYLILEEWQDQTQNEKVYKIVICMNQNMLKVHQRLRQRFILPPTHSNSSVTNQTNQSNNQSSNQANNQSNSQSNNQSSHQANNQSNSQSNNQSSHQANNQSNNQSNLSGLSSLSSQSQNNRVHFSNLPGEEPIALNFEEQSQNSQGTQPLAFSPNQVPQQQPHQQFGQQSQASIKIYQDFQNRGKYEHMKYSFSNVQRKLTIKIKKKFYLNQLKLKEFQLIMIAQSFVKHWNQEYIQIIQVFIRYQKDFRGHTAIKFSFVSIDMLAITIQVKLYANFQIIYNDSKKFRFRYSPFQFRYHPLFRERGLQQTLSYMEIGGSNYNQLTQSSPDSDYYTNFKLSFMDDINNNQLLKRLISRFWVFFQIQNLNRGRQHTDSEQFNRKSLGRVYFHSVRMKKFSLVWNFELLHNKTTTKDCGKGCSRQISQQFTFYLDDKDIKTDPKGGVQFKMVVNIAQHDNYLTFNQKEELYQRLFQQFNKTHQCTHFFKKDIPQKLDEAYEFILSLKFDKQIGKTFGKIQNIISFCIDRWVFTHYNKMNPANIDSRKTIQLVSEPSIYKQDKYVHTHSIQVHICHWYFHEHVDQRNPQSKYYSDSIQLQKVIKKKTKTTQKKSQFFSQQKNQVAFHDSFRKYINILLKTAPLRQCYAEIVQFIQQVTKVIYSKPKQRNAGNRYENRQKVLQTIVKTLTKIFQISNYHQRSVSIKILTQESPFLVKVKQKQNKGEQQTQNRSQLYAEVTFSIKQLKVTWIKRLPLGYMVIRMFTDKLEITIDEVLKNILVIPHNLDSVAISQLYQKLQNEVRKLLYKESIQKMQI